MATKKKRLEPVLKNKGVLKFTINGHFEIPDVSISDAFEHLKCAVETLRELASADAKYKIETENWYDVETEL